MKSLIEKTRNAKDIMEIARRCVDSPENFDDLIRCIKHQNYHTSTRAAWAMSHAVAISPTILQQKHHKSLIRIVNLTSTSSLKRNIMRAWQFVVLPENLRYEIGEIALRLLGSHKEDIAVKVFSISVLQNCLKHIPERKAEILFILEKEIPHASAAYQVRARRLMNVASKII